MTATTTTTASIPKSATPARGKAAAQGVLSIAPSPRDRRAVSGGSPEDSPFASVLKDAKAEQAPQQPAVEAKPDNPTNLRDVEPAQRENDAGASPDAVAAPSDETKAPDADASEASPEPEAGGTPQPVDQKAAVASGEAQAIDVKGPAFTDVSGAAGTELQAEAQTVAQAAGPSKPAPGKPGKAAIRAAGVKETIDPLGLIARGPAPAAKGADAAPEQGDVDPQASIPSRAEANPVLSPAASIDDRARQASDALPARTDTPAVQETVANSTPQEDARPSDDRPSNAAKPREATQTASRDPQAHDVQTRESGSLPGLGSAAPRVSSTPVGGIRLTLQTPPATSGQGSPEGEALSAQAARGLAAAFKHKGGTVTLHLTPESLGQIKVKITVEDAKVSAMIQTSTEQAKRLLESSGDSLRSALESKGLTVDRVQITHASPGLSELRESSRGSAGGDGAPQHDRAGEGGHSSGGFADQGRSGEGDRRQAWKSGMSDADDIFNLKSIGDADAAGGAIVPGAPIALTSPARGPRVREGVVRLSVDAVA